MLELNSWSVTTVQMQPKYFKQNIFSDFAIVPHTFKMIIA